MIQPLSVAEKTQTSEMKGFACSAQAGGAAGARGQTALGLQTQPTAAALGGHR